MPNYTDQTRLLVAKREDEDYPMIIGAMPMTTWEVIPPEDWDQWKRECARDSLADDWTAYDYVEIVITIPSAKLKALFDAREFNFVEAPLSPSKPLPGGTHPIPPATPADGGRMAEDGPQASSGFIHMGPGPHIGTDNGGEYC